MAELTKTLQRDLITHILNISPAFFRDSDLFILCRNYPQVSVHDKTALLASWARLTSLEKRIFESPENYANVVAEWHRQNKY